MSLPPLRRVRWAVRATLVLGVAASVAANILHALDNPISQAIAAWPPLALLLTVELISRVPVHRRSLAIARLVATATIAGIAAWVSYWHMAGVAARYGETGTAAHLLPLSVDGLIVVASISLVELTAHLTVEAQDPIKTPQTAELPTPVPVPVPAVLPKPPPTTASPQQAAKQTTAKPRRTPAETLKAAATIKATTPDITDAALAKKLGITTARWRAISREADQKSLRLAA